MAGALGDFLQALFKHHGMVVVLRPIFSVISGFPSGSHIQNPLHHRFVEITAAMQRRRPAAAMRLRLASSASRARHFAAHSSGVPQNTASSSSLYMAKMLAGALS